MNKTKINNSVTDFQNEIARMFDAYLKANQNAEIGHLLKTEYDYEKNELIKGLWYIYVIEILPSNDLTIWAYEDNRIELQDFIKAKMGILKKWSKKDLFSSFNKYLISVSEIQNIRDIYNIEVSLRSYSTLGWEWLQKLQNDETKKLNFASKKLGSKFKKLNIKKDQLISEKIELLKKLALDDYNRTIKLVEKEPQKYDQLVFKYEEIALREPNCKKSSGKPHLTNIISYIHKLTKKDKRTIAKRLERYRISKGQLPPRKSS